MTSLGSSLRSDGRVAFARVTALVTAALLAVVALARATPLSEAASLVAWPALAAAFLLDTAAYNELGVVVGDAGFWALFVVFAVVQAAAVVAVARRLRGRFRRRVNSA
ncbi:hypothetical protein Hbl1158_04240 [Halobaculum sp. CBA1158]|uniref:hypothetical protein n=1 Tax=Halobaculum sp. CBA1158 TaxID=2904243 RepID=UPI001F2DDAD8|nr:hypothetical protein [Halobaculum sp. CBA1158]UIP00578.1 hypothetical protein Hbl1158_04240 [Halobaculum sp. CBA1158]